MTLSDTARITKKVIVYVGVALIIIFALWGGIAYYMATRPIIEYIELPTKGFGILPKPVLPKTRMTASSVTYDLNTETGSLPEGLPVMMKIYFIPKQGVTYATPQRAKYIASNFSFPNGPRIVSPTIHKFTDDKGGELIYDLDSNNFRFKRPIATKSADFEDQQTVTIEEETRLVNNFKKYLNDQGVLSASLDAGKYATFYNNAKVSEATEAAITLWQKDIIQGTEEQPIAYPIVNPNFKEGLVRGVVTKFVSPQNKYLSVDFIYWSIDTARTETYPIKTVKDAYDQLQNGEGITVLPYSKSSVAIENVYLGYLLPKEYTPYLQPVYVFEGPGFAAYVPAITPDNFEP